MLIGLTAFNLHYDIPELLEHWLRINAKQFDKVVLVLMATNGEQSDSSYVVKLASEYANVTVYKNRVNVCDRSAGCVMKNVLFTEVREELRAAGVWICPSDIDEFVQWGSTAREVVAAADSSGSNVVVGELRDRTAPGGAALPVTKTDPFRVFTKEWDLTKYEKRQFNKVVAVTGDVDFSNGHHLPVPTHLGVAGRSHCTGPFPVDEQLRYFNLKAPLPIAHFSWHAARIKQLEFDGRDHRIAAAALYTKGLPPIPIRDVKEMAPVFMVPHIYENACFEEKWFTYPTFYKEIVRWLPDGCTVVEVGSWKGRSVAFMAVEILRSGKFIRVHAVDTWRGTVGHATHARDPHIINGSLFELFMSNIRCLRHVITPVREPSVQASSRYADESLPFVFIDADHSYEGARSDILAWLPKVAKGGILAGHDIKLQEVVRAVKDCLGVAPTVKIDKEQDIWIYQKP